MHVSVDRQTDGPTVRQTDRQTGVSQGTSPNTRATDRQTDRQTKVIHTSLMSSEAFVAYRQALLWKRLVSPGLFADGAFVCDRVLRAVAAILASVADELVQSIPPICTVEVTLLIFVFFSFFVTRCTSV